MKDLELFAQLFTDQSECLTRYPDQSEGEFLCWRYADQSERTFLCGRHTDQSERTFLCWCHTDQGHFSVEVTPTNQRGHFSVGGYIDQSETLEKTDNYHCCYACLISLSLLSNKLGHSRAVFYHQVNQLV